MTSIEPSRPSLPSIPLSRMLAPRREAPRDLEATQPLLPQAVRTVGALALTFAAEYALRRLAGSASSGLVRSLASRVIAPAAVPSTTAAVASKAVASALPDAVTERVIGVGRVVVTEFMVIERRTRRP